jgi:hypothetical protein
MATTSGASGRRAGVSPLYGFSVCSDFQVSVRHAGRRAEYEPGGEITDNAYMESSFHSMRSDTVHGVTFADDRELEQLLRSHPHPVLQRRAAALRDRVLSTDRV